MAKIVFDGGHGGNDTGAVGPTGLMEKNVVMNIMFQAADILINRGLDVIFTRETDKRVELSERVRIANNAKADLFVSFHANSAGNMNATGTETFAFKPGTNGDKLAKSIQKNLVNEINLPDRGVKYSNFTVLAKTTMPAVLNEVAFINNPREESLLKSREFIEKAAIGIAKGILEYLGISYIPNTKPKVKIKYKGRMLEVEGVFQDNKNYVAIRELLEGMGHKVDWNEATKTVVVK